MIEDPPVLVVRRRFPRPDPEVVAALADVPTGNLVDAMDGSGALDWRIQALVPQLARACGVALTVEAGPADNLAIFAAIEIAKPGDVLVVATGGHTGCALIGDLLMGMARNHGIAALVTDGLARDTAGIAAVGVPVFCQGTSPNSPARGGPGRVGFPVVVGGVTVASGDVVVADPDGVVIAPRPALGAILPALDRVRAAEVALEGQVRAGLAVPDFYRRLREAGLVREVED
jgi:4-hydroxy-4-methyl-2-oxoglutarate aldolase